MSDLPRDAVGVAPRSVSGAPSPARRSRQAQQAIQDRIKDWILDHGLYSGDPMPTEWELIEHLNVSRNSTREALKALQALGIVEIRHGFGTYVGDCSLEPFADALIFRGRMSMRGDRHELREILDLRRALEAGLMNLLIDTIDEEALTRLRARLHDLEACAGKGEAGDAADRAFHDELYGTMGNQLMSQLLRVFWDVYHDLSHELPPVEENRDNIVAVHRAIYEAVAARDAAQAMSAVKEHFAGIQLRLDTADRPPAPAPVD
ncbi:FCD domain-containing protein [Acidiferrimicrobium sp. IK]|uniref:FadR/GntR family transcriptional regulator n=1 Tax=Acidiferrimicrobium sp. IK TaxID=2871700 RepID=UPI0021CB0B65|nr:FCD domain-containing protein [Acidiferrimicrobium sp. IK]MCU4183335.1 FCD domain-containing protein [Acidiferrimicrobium sp. IK]